MFLHILNLKKTAALSLFIGAAAIDERIEKFYTLPYNFSFLLLYNRACQQQILLGDTLEHSLIVRIGKVILEIKVTIIVTLTDV